MNLGQWNGSVGFRERRGDGFARRASRPTIGLENSWKEGDFSMLKSVIFSKIVV